MPLEEMKAQLFSVSDTEKGLLVHIGELYVQEIRSEKKYLAVALSELHNSGMIDVIELVKGVGESFSDHEIFKILYVFEQVLPLLKSDIEDVLSCLVYLKQQVDMGRVYSVYQDYCSVDVIRPEKSIEFILSQDQLDSYAPFLCSAILAFNSDYLVVAIWAIEKLIVHENSVVRNQSYLALGSLDVGESQASDIWVLVCARAKIEKNDICCASLLRSILYFGARFPSYWQLIEEQLIIFTDTVSAAVQYEISDTIAFQRVELPDNILHILLKKLASVPPDHGGIINNIDYVLVELLKRGLSPSAVELVESSLANGVKLTSFGSFSRELLNNHKDLLAQLITKWFLSGRESSCWAVFDLLHDDVEEKVQLKADSLILDDDVKQLFVCRKAIGWFFTRPLTAASFILSIYGFASAAVQKDIEGLLYHPLLLSYPGKVRKYLQACVEDNMHIPLCESLLGKLEYYHNSLEQIDGLKELRAPAEDVNTYWKDFDRSMQKSQAEGPKSIFEDICTVQNLLYGNSSTYYLDDGSGKPIRQEMEMRSFSHSSEMPMLNVLDPEHLDYMLRVYRHEGMKDEADS